jgi:MFS superfamily sulfate permease-like transporter
MREEVHLSIGAPKKPLHFCIRLIFTWFGTGLVCLLWPVKAEAASGADWSQIWTKLVGLGPQLLTVFGLLSFVIAVALAWLPKKNGPVALILYGIAISWIILTLVESGPIFL